MQEKSNDTLNGGNHANGAQDVGALGTAHVDAVTRTSKALLDTSVEISREIFEFGKKRLVRQADIAQAIVKTPNPLSAMELQAQFVNDMVADYADQAMKIVNLSARAAGQLPGQDVT